MDNLGQFKIAIAHDSFTQLGGAERVVEVLHEMFPNAPVYTLVLDKKFKEKYKTWDIRVSWLQRMYDFFPKLRYFLPLIPLAVTSLDFSGYDLVISSSSGWIKNIKLPKNCVHINYCHSPARFLWVDNDYLWNELPWTLKPFYFLGKLFLLLLKKWDYKGAQKVDYFIANSKEVQKRIKDFYHRDSEVVYPSLDIEFWHKTKEKSNYFLLAGRLQPHKNNEQIIKIFNEIGLSLHVVGIGRQEKYLKSIAKPNITFLGRITDEALRDEYSSALGYIYPQVEDFGLMPIEAAACGTATLGIAKGGSLETVVPGVTGELFENYDVEEIKNIIRNWNISKYKTADLINQAEKFSKEKFKQKIIKLIDNL
jgi:glycosyltransferase involved in cell wall biosynthesis